MLIDKLLKKNNMSLNRFIQLLESL